MSKIAVVTDSVACIPPALLKKYNIYVAPVQITWDRVTYHDGVDMTPQQFYSRLKSSKTLPTTASSIQGEYLQIFNEIKGKYDGVVTLALTGGLGSSFNSAINARELAGNITMEIIDTRTAMMAQGFVVLEAAKVASAGGSMNEVAQAARQAMPRTGIIWAMDTLEYLRRGGRVSMPQAILAGWLNVKPVMAIEAGKVAPLARPRSKIKAMETMLNMVQEKTTGAEKLHLAVMHGVISDELFHFEKMVSSKFKTVELLRGEITPVIGTHTGPGTLGIAYYNESP
jgi:DegV family protein with EDD domain